MARSKAQQQSTSTWTIGWWTPTLLIASYLCATIIAIIHLLLFRYLDGKVASGPDQIVSQSYISTTSNVLATGFQIIIQLSLGTAFVQYLWYVFRVRSLRVSVIEDLFTIRTSPFLMLRLSTLKSAPVLVCLACLIWSTYISTSFPPGAISVGSEQNTVVKPTNVSTFNASFMRNGSGIEAALFSLDIFKDSHENWLSSESIAIGTLSPALQRMANGVVVDGLPAPIPSPCGANCSYTLEFDGPWFQCNESSSNATSNNKEFTQIYNGHWNNPQYPGLESLTVPIKNYLNIPVSNQSNSSLWTGSFEVTFSANTLAPLAYIENETSSSDVIFSATLNNLTCQPTRATYTLQNSYENNIQTINVSVADIHPLVNFYQDDSGFFQDFYSGSGGPGVYVPGIFTANITLGTASAQWSQDAIEWYRDLNLMNLIGVATDAIAGSYISSQIVVLPGSTTTYIPGVGNATYGLGSLDLLTSLDEPDNGPQNGTLIGNSRFNNYLDMIQTSGLYDQPIISFTVTEDMLNDLLKNITITAITYYDLWNTTTNATINSTILIYRLSSPQNILLPYGLTLLFALPFIILGFWALRENGVAAIDGGFIQPVCTSMGSEALEREALIACLGGPENIPHGLKNLELRFGELRSGRGRAGIIGTGYDGVIAKAGFGTEDEILPLRKGVKYGKLARC